MQVLLDIKFIYFIDIQHVIGIIILLSVKPLSKSHTFKANSAHDGRQSLVRHFALLVLRVKEWQFKGSSFQSLVI